MRQNGFMCYEGRKAKWTHWKLCANGCRRVTASCSLEGLASARSPGFPTFAVWMACTIKNLSTRRRPSSVTAFTVPIQPNVTHQKLAQWEQEGKLLAVVTQNIDGLHQKAGSRRVYELHGSVLRNYCEKCGKFYPAEYVKHAQGVPLCTCGGTVKPDVVLYEESLDEKTLTGSICAIGQADLLMVGGTSLTVYPAAGLIQYYRGNRLVLINRDETPYDGYANLVLHRSLGEVFSQL